MPIQIRGASHRDVDQVVELLGAQYIEHAIVLSPATLQEAVRILISDPGRGAILVANDSNVSKVVGIAVLAYAWGLEYGGRIAWLDELFVDSNQRDRGVGRALLQRALVVAKEAGCRTAQLEVAAGHERAEHLYRREGFRPVPRRRWSCPL